MTKLGDSDDDLGGDSAASWVEKMRKQEEEKKMAEKRVSCLCLNQPVTPCLNYVLCATSSLSLSLSSFFLCWGFV